MKKSRQYTHWSLEIKLEPCSCEAQTLRAELPSHQSLIIDLKLQKIMSYQSTVQPRKTYQSTAVISPIAQLQVYDTYAVRLKHVIFVHVLVLFIPQSIVD